MSQAVRFAPSSLDAVYWRAGSIVVQRQDGSERALASGHHPGWLDSASVAYCPPGEGVVQVATPSGIAQLTVPAGNTLTAASGKVAVHRTDPRRTICSWLNPWGQPSVIYEATDPALSADGRWMAILSPDHPAPGNCSLSLVDTVSHHMRSTVYVGAAQRPRFSNTGTTLVWEDGGALYGIRDVANPSSPVVRLTRPGDACFHGVPCWAPERGELLLCYVQAVSDTEADVIVAGWESCVAQQPTGYIVARSGGSGFDLDCKEAA